MAMVCSSVESSSSPSRVIRKYYDVFVSFRGKDTRYNFIDHLFGALQRKGIITFRDDTKLKKGKPIAPELPHAIEGSQVLIVVFSKNYASSTWCLRELAKILDCVQVLGKHVMPIFYDVDPSEVRKQSGDYKKSLIVHEERFKNDLEMMGEVKKWKEALTQVANFSGWDIRNKSQYGEIEKIVEEIISILGYKFSSLCNDLTGMQSPLEELEKLLLLNSVDDVRVVGIHRMGGTGKTTLATVLYGRISYQYAACCLIDDISKIYRVDGAVGAQKQLLEQLLREENLQISNLFIAPHMIKSRLSHIRALVVLDNVDQYEQLEKLVVNREWLGAGSKIIIISRDEHILNEYGVDDIYEVPFLNWENSTQLFCRKAFKCENIMTGYEELTRDAINYANGLPLAIKVLGSFLYGRDVPEWRSALARIRENPNKDILDVLRSSFDGLDNMEKEIFLDIACFFNGENEQYVEKILNYCGFYADIGIRILIDKSLISITQCHMSSHNIIRMHGLLEELGKKIVQENSTKENCSRKFNQGVKKVESTVAPKIFPQCHVGAYGKEENVEAIVLSSWPRFEKTETWMIETLSKMSRLKLLILHDVFFSGRINCLSNELKYVMWDYYPFKCLPSNFQLNQVVELILQESNIEQLWEGKKYLPNLRTLDLSFSKYLIKMPNFEEVPNIEFLNLQGCEQLVQLDPSIGLLRKLAKLNLHNCKSLVSIPNNILGLSSLEYLDLSYCSKISVIPRDANHWKKLDTSETTSPSQSMSSIFKQIMGCFHFLFPKVHEDPSSASCLLLSLPTFSYLCILDISFCRLSQIPEAIGSLHCLEILDLKGNNFVTLPSLKELSTLVHLNMDHCKHLKSLPDLPSPTSLPQEDRVFNNHQWWREYTAGLYIFNCPKMGEREHYIGMVFLWMTQLIQATEETFTSFKFIEIVIPGSEIPRWFNNGSAGCSISIDPSPIVHDNNCFGLACYAIMRNQRVPSVYLSFKFKGNYGFGYGSDIPLSSEAYVFPVERDMLTVESENHMWLLYFSRQNYLNFMRENNLKMDDLVNIKLRIQNAEGQGFRWVYKHDLELFDVTMMHSGNSSAEQCKFLAIEDKAKAQP